MSSISEPAPSVVQMVESPRGGTSDDDTSTGGTSSGKGTAGRGFRPDIQGLRAIAVTLVVVYHLWPSVLPGGYAGVDVFFVISGFLITGHLLREHQQTGRVCLVTFWG